jgi:hypothetical protein
MVSLEYYNSYPKLRQEDLMREAEMERLARLAVGPRRPLRAAIADWLFATAEWVEGTPRGSITRASARVNL